MITSAGNANRRKALGTVAEFMVSSPDLNAAYGVCMSERAPLTSRRAFAYFTGLQANCGGARGDWARRMDGRLTLQTLSGAAHRAPSASGPAGAGHADARAGVALAANRHGG